MVAQVGYSVAGRSRGRVAPCAVCTVHVETRSACFLVEPQNHGRWFVSGLTSKPLGQFLIGLGIKTDDDGLSMFWPQNHWDDLSSIWASKPMVTFCEWFGLKTTQTVFTSSASKLVVMVSGGLASKPVATVFTGLALKPVAKVFSSLASKLVAMVFSSLASKLVATVSPGLASKHVVGFLVEPQNQGGGRFLGLGLQTKWALVCRLRHKTNGRRLAWDTRRDLAA
jgi:hypothetical protein